MKMGKRLLLLFALVLLLGSCYVWFFIWNKPRQNIKNAEAVKVEAAALFQAYSTNEQAANAMYIDKVVEVTGTVASVSKNNEGKTVLMLKTDDPMFGVNCTMEEEIKTKEGDLLTLKGICTGYLTDVVLIRCYKIK